MVISDPKNNAFRNNLFVPNQVPLKLGSSANMITLPDPSLPTIIDADFFTRSSDDL
jgi:hypothetical protein